MCSPTTGLLSVSFSLNIALQLKVIRRNRLADLKGFSGPRRPGWLRHNVLNLN